MRVARRSRGGRALVARRLEGTRRGCRLRGGRAVCTVRTATSCRCAASSRCRTTRAPGWRAGSSGGRPLHGRCMAVAWPLRGRILCSTPVDDRYMAVAWPLRGRYVAFTWLLRGFYVAVTGQDRLLHSWTSPPWRLHEDYMEITWRSPAPLRWTSPPPPQGRRGTASSPPSSPRRSRLRPRGGFAVVSQRRPQRGCHAAVHGGFTAVSWRRPLSPEMRMDCPVRSVRMAR